MNEPIDLQELHRLFGCVVRYTNHNLITSITIARKIDILCGYLHGYSWEQESHQKKQAIKINTQNFVIEELYFECIINKKYLRYDLNKNASLYTWVEYFVFYYIRNLLRKFKPKSLEKENKSMLDVFDENNKNFRISEVECEEWNLLPSNTASPEELLIAKQLYSLAKLYFSETDLEMLLGKKSVEDIVTENKWNRNNYNLQLYRRRVAFRNILPKFGYEF